MFVIPGPALVDMDLVGGRLLIRPSLGAVAVQPNSSITVIHTIGTGTVLFTFRTLCRRTAVGKKIEKTLETHPLNVWLREIFWVILLVLMLRNSHTDLIFWQGQILHITLIWFAVGQVPQLLRRPLVQLAADLFILAPVGEVVRREAAVVQAVNVGAEVKEATDQCRVLEIHSKVEWRSSTALFLQKTTWNINIRFLTLLFSWELFSKKKEEKVMPSFTS